jgi:hypothetical protein
MRLLINVLHLENSHGEDRNPAWKKVQETLYLVRDAQFSDVRDAQIAEGKFTSLSRIIEHSDPYSRSEISNVIGLEEGENVDGLDTAVIMEFKDNKWVQTY